jgi:hypothetical protein
MSFLVGCGLSKATQASRVSLVITMTKVEASNGESSFNEGF